MFPLFVNVPRFWNKIHFLNPLIKCDQKNEKKDVKDKVSVFLSWEHLSQQAEKVKNYFFVISVAMNDLLKYKLKVSEHQKKFWFCEAETLRHFSLCFRFSSTYPNFGTKYIFWILSSSVIRKMRKSCQKQSLNFSQLRMSQSIS